MSSDERVPSWVKLLEKIVVEAGARKRRRLGKA